MDVGRDWDLFAALLMQELGSLGASEEETEIVLDRAWHRATEVESVTDFARGALELCRRGAFPYDRRVDSAAGQAIVIPHHRERDPDQG
jgi:hypothetical protein